MIGGFGRAPLDACTGGAFVVDDAALLALMFVRSMRLSSAPALALLRVLGAAGAVLRGAGMADLGVSGLVAVWSGSGPDLPEEFTDECVCVLWAAATPIRIPIATSPGPNLNFIKLPRQRILH